VAKASGSGGAVETRCMSQMSVSGSWMRQPATSQSGRQSTMSLYEMRTYTLHVGKMAEAVKLYQELGFPALQKGGHDENLVGYFQSDTGMINQLVHLWKFKDDG
jgi:hypothetical protein